MLRFDDHNALVFKEIVNEHVVNAHVLKSAFNNTFLEVAVESKNLLVEFNKSGFELFVNVAANVVNELGLRKRLGGLSLVRSEVSNCRFWHSVKRDLEVVAVSVFL